ncbi:MAG: DNA-binding protein [Oscillospiraceae bacterium]|jgi:hypothetical protein|nr:DNA-binding protein [Oscillospiraceae bacterium]
MDVKFTDYKRVNETGSEWGVTTRMVILYCTAGRIPGALKSGGIWFIPRDAKKPEDGRRNNRRQPKKTE